MLPPRSGNHVIGKKWSQGHYCETRSQTYSIGNPAWQDMWIQRENTIAKRWIPLLPITTRHNANNGTWFWISPGRFWSILQDDSRNPRQVLSWEGNKNYRQGSRLYDAVYQFIRLRTLDSRSGSKDLWAAVKRIKNKGQNEIIADNVDATVLNNHYATISSDSNYSKPCQKSSAALRTTPFSEYEVFKILDRLKPTATGLDKLPAWYLRLGAPVFAKHLANLFNRSIQDSVVPTQWKAAYIRPVQKIPTPTQSSDYRPISITPVLSLMMEKMVVKEFIYPAMNDPPPELSFSDQFAFKPAGSTTAAIIDMFQAIIKMLQTNPYVIVIALDFSKAFDTVRHASVAEKMAKLNMPDNVYNWIIDFLEGHSHQTNFGGQKSQFLKISASIIQGSGLGPATYSVVASDLCPLFPGNRLFKFADDTYLVIPASNVNSRCLELKHVQDWATANNLQLNTKKSQEMVFTKPRGRNSSKVVVPAIPDVERVTSLKMLGVIISHNFSMDEHVSAVISSSGQTLYALRILKSHGMSNACLQAVYQSTVVSRLTYACQAWRGFASRAALDRLDSFLKRSIKAGFYPPQSPMYEELCEALENGLFQSTHGQSSPPSPPSTSTENNETARH